MAKLKKMKKSLSQSDIAVLRQYNKAKLEERKEINNARFEENKKYYEDKLTSMVNDTLSVINKETTPEELAAFLKTGDKEWKSLCSVGRKTKKISVPVDMYMQTMMANLVQRKILTIPEEQKEGEQNFKLNKEDEEGKVNDIPQDVVEDNSINRMQESGSIDGESK